MFGSGKRILGVDLGSSEVKVVEMMETGDGLAITGFEATRINSPDETRFALKEILRHGNFKTKRSVTAVSGRSVIVRYVPLLQMSEEDLQKAIRREADKFIPFELDEVVLDCQILEQGNPREDTERLEMRVLLVAVKRSLIEEHVAFLQETGLQPVIIDVDAFALGNAYELRNKNINNDPGERVVALIDIGGNKTNINIMKGSVSYFTREVYLAGADFSEAISRRLGIDLEEAENLKQDPKERVNEIEECSMSTLDDLSNEIQLSFDYFENQYDLEVEEVFVSGGSSRLPGLARSFQATFDREIHFWDPLENFDVRADNIDLKRLKKASPQLAVAVGLASRLRSLK